MDFCHERGIDIAPEDAQILAESAKGYPLMIELAMNEMERTARIKGTHPHFTQEILESAKLRFFVYMQGSVFAPHPAEERTLVLSVAPFERFDIGLALALAGYSNAESVIRRLQRTTRMFSEDGIGRFRLWRNFQDFLIWEMKQEWSPEEREALYLKAAAYFEKQDDIVMAIRSHNLCSRHAKVIQLLERHAQEDPRHGHFRELELYYLAVPEDEAQDSPDLMMGLSMVSFLRADFDVSRSWYERLSAYAACPGHSLEKQKQLEADIRYLDIACLVRSADSAVDLMPLISQDMDEDEPAYRSFTFSARADFLPSSMAAVTSASGRSMTPRSIASLQNRSSVHEKLMASAFLTVPLARAPFCVARMCVPGCWISRRRSRISISMALAMPRSLRQDCLPARR